MASPRWVDPGPDPFDFGCPLRSCLPKLPGFLRMAGMISCTLLIDLCNSSACIAVAGRIFADDPQILAGVSVGSMLFNICLLSTSYGMASGLDTLLAQAHGAVQADEIARRRERSWPGAVVSPQPPHPGRSHVRWTVLLLFLVWVPLGAMCFFSDSILRAVGQPVEVSRRAGSFARVLTVAAGVPLVCRTVQGKIINNARVTWPPLLGSCAGSVAHALFLYALYAHMDTDGILPSDGDSSASASSDFGSGSVLFDKIARVLRWGHADAFLGAALGRAVYAVTSVVVTGLYLVLSCNPICPTGCCISCGGDSGGGYKQTTGRLRGGTRSGAGRDAYTPLTSPASDPHGDDDRPDVTSSPIRTRSFNDDGGRLPERGAGPGGLCVVASLAVPSMLSMVAEWWASEFRGLIAGWIHSSAAAPPVATIMAANGVVFMFTVIFYQIPKGLGIAASVRCGNALGAGKPTEAKGEAFMGLSTAGIVSLFSAAAYELLAARVVLGWLAGNSEVLRLAVEVSLPTALCMVGFSIMMVAIQLLNSCGRNSQGTLVAFIACWAVGVSASLVLGLVGFAGVKGLAGIWWGNALGLGVGALLGLVAVGRVDFYEEARAAQRRSNAKGLL